MTTKLVVTDRTSRGLASALFDELDNLINGKSTPQLARAKSALATTICAISRLEMDFARFVSEPRSDEGKMHPIEMGRKADALPRRPS